jgi:muconolactone D-isomerase
MMEFLVNMKTRVPGNIDPRRHDDLYRAQARRAAELCAEGRIKRLWRVPGRRESWGLWEAGDATSLHAALASLPLWRYQEIEVIPLAGNGSDPGSDEQAREMIRRIYPLGG